MSIRASCNKAASRWSGYICGGFGPPLRAKLQVDGGEKCDGFRALKTQLETGTFEAANED